jgi:1,4-dihydroxy-2-naphthoate octaprenyltransferase
MVVSFFPALLGGLAAWADHSWSFGVFLMTLFCVWSLHAGANLWNDYHDELSGTDRMQAKPSSFNGGSRVIQDGLLTAAQVRTIAVVCLALGGVLGIAASLLGSIKAMFFLIVGLLAAWGYSAPPARWAGSGWGEAVVGISFGPLLTGGVYLTQTGRLAVEPMIASVVLGLFVATILCVNEIPDRDVDRLTNKLNWSVRKSPEAFEWMIQLMITAAYLIVLVGWTFAWLPRFSILAALSYPLALRVSKGVHLIKEGNLKANEDLIKLFMVFGIILSMSFLVGRWTG